MAERQFTAEERRRLAAAGEAMPDGSYPTPDADALQRAIEAYGRAPEAERPELRRYLVRRAVALGRTDLIPDTWEVRPHG